MSDLFFVLWRRACVWLAQSGYFDKGFSNYNSVAQFFDSVLDVNMLENVLYDRKNMLYEDLLEYVCGT